MLESASACFKKDERGDVWDIIFEEWASDFEQIKERVRAVLECASATRLARRVKPVSQISPLPGFRSRIVLCRFASHLFGKPHTEAQLLNLFQFPVLVM